MIKNIIRDPLFLSRKSSAASPGDAATGRDLLDTLIAHRDGCVGMAANMIGVLKRIIVFFDGETPVLMYDPVILKKSGPYETEEGCLSLPGVRKTVRYRSIRVRYRDGAGRVKTKDYTGFTAQVIQHEIDHCDGILI